MEAVVEDKYLRVIACLGLKASQQPGPAVLGLNWLQAVLTADAWFVKTGLFQNLS